ncbi:MAG: cupin domain-containing protein [Muribaculaceae bacterium]|nr:cupin domain-containing protein [Muribaculaceae bacterium]
MNESKKSVFADQALSVDGASNIDGCDAAVLPQATDGEAESVELLRTCQSWDGANLPDYPQGQPELVAIKYIIPPGKKLNWHHHLVMNHGVLVQGELTIIALDGKTKVMRAGDVVVEMVDTIHHGENRGTEPVVLYMFYLSQKDKPLSVQYPELPL